MQVGDLVRHQMYNELKKPALVVAVQHHNGRSIWIKLFDPDDGVVTWDNGKDYEVISAVR